MKFSIKDFFSKCDQIRSHLLKKSLIENFIFAQCMSVSNIVVHRMKEQQKSKEMTDHLVALCSQGNVFVSNYSSKLKTSTETYLEPSTTSMM